MAFDQAGHHTESGWGISYFGHLSQSRIHDDKTAFIPATARADFGSLSDINDVHRWTLTGGVGIGGIAVYEKFYTAGLVALGAGPQWLTVTDMNNKREHRELLGSYATLRAIIGYNGIKHIFGSQYIVESVNSTVRDGEISGSLQEGSLFYAYRFDNVSFPPLDWVSSWFDSKTPEQ